MPEERLNRQMDFMIEIDKLKNVLRRSHLVGADRRENSAEHSWHAALMALLLAEHAGQPVELLTVLKMLLVHDLVEIDAGDTFYYDDVGALHKAEREEKAADRIFGMLPGDQGAELRTLWEEFESGASAEARFARAVDRLMPFLHNYHTQGKTWKEHGVTRDQAIERNAHIADGSPALWQWVCELIRDAVSRGYLPA
jgi:putative hydrolase of HD superfamily